MDKFGRQVGNLRIATLKRVSSFSDTQNRNSGARGECHLVPYPSLWTRHFFYFFEFPSSLLTPSSPEEHFGSEPGGRVFESLPAHH